MNSSRRARNAAGGAEGIEVELERHRRELLMVCYQMLGSPHDAEDVVQETMARAWRAREGYDPRLASVRTWLHRIAFNASLDALASRARRPLPSTLVAPSDDPGAPLVATAEVPWLLPMATSRFDDDPQDPAARAVRSGAIRLAFCAAIQWLPPRQRAALILCDVLQFSAGDAAETLSTTVQAVNSLLQRARRTLSTRSEGIDARLAQVDELVVGRYTTAFIDGDVATLRTLLAADAVLEMPPVPLWYRGADLYGAFMHRVFELRGTVWKTVPVRANGQAGFAAYADEHGTFRLHTVQILSTDGGLVTRNVVYQHAGTFGELGLRPTI